jgi:hypothetical protein
MQTKEFCTNLATKISQETPPNVKDALQVRNPPIEDAKNTLIKARAALLPAIPISFIVVKDVHIILKTQGGFSSNEVSDLQKRMSAGGGILCFSCSKSQSSSDHRTAASVVQGDDSLSIRIPAPQIIGWVQELTPLDETQDLGKYNALQENEFAGVQLPTNLAAGRAKPASAVPAVPAVPLEV